MNFRRFLILTVLLFCIGAGYVSPQIRTGSMAGTVVDEAEAVLPGVTITLTSPQLIAPQVSRVSNVNGLFRFPYLPPGTYTLKAELTGFSTYVIQGIIVKLGLTTDVVVNMTQASLEEEVLVVSEAPIMSIENTKLSTNVSTEEIHQLPINRSLYTVVDLAPGVIGAQSMGAGSRENTFSVDGVAVTDPGSGSGLGASQSIDAYEEIQIETGGHAAEHGNASGALVNVITKSGGNAFHGDFSFYFRSDSLQSENHEGTGLSASTTETNYNYDINANLGGPIIKDKIWFFLSSGYSPSSYSYYGFAEDVTIKSVTPLGKLTLQPHVKHRIHLSFNYNWTNQPYMFASRWRTPEACFNRTTQAYSYKLNWLFSVSNNTIIEAGANYLYRPTDYLSRGRSVTYYDLVTSVSSGSSNDCLQERLRWQAKANITHFLDDKAGDHELKAGIEYERGESRNATNFFPDEYGMCSYYLMDGVPYMAIKYDPPQMEAQVDPYDQYAVFAQDSWRINRFINLNLGFRFNYIDAYTPPQHQQTITLPIADWKTLEPRIALGIDPFGDGKTGIKLSYSRYATMMWTWFYGLNPNGSTSTVYFVLGPGQFMPLYSSSPYAFEVDPDLKRPYVNEIFFSLDRTIGKDFLVKLNYVDRQFKNFVTVIDSAVTEEWYDPIQVTNPLTGEAMTVYNRDMSAPDPVDYYNNDPRAKRSYRAVIFELIKRMSHNFQFRFSYTYSQLKGTTSTSSSMMATGPWNNPNNTINNYGLLSGDHTHVLKFQGIYMAPLGFVLSTTYNGRSGYPYGYYFQTELNQGATAFPAEAPDARRTPFLHYWDIRLAKDFTIKQVKLSLFAEVYNVLNLNESTGLYSQVGNPYYELDEITSIQSPRIAMLGCRVVF